MQKVHREKIKEIKFKIKLAKDGINYENVNKKPFSLLKLALLNKNC